MNLKHDAKDMQIGLALGAGAARGWAHIGVIQALMDNGIEPDIVCGTSAGALVGGAYAAGHLEELEQWLCSLSRLDVVRFYDLSWSSSGLLAGKRIIDFFRQRFGDVNIRSLYKTYAAVATNLTTGNEVWFRSGSLMDAIRASISVPGIFEPFYLDGNWYIDGGIVNPIPVSICRALGADMVIAVDVNHAWKSQIGKDLKAANYQTASLKSNEALDSEIFPLSLTKGIKDRIGEAISSVWRGNAHKPGLFQILQNSAHFMQGSITRSRLACDPPDINLYPNTNGIGLMDFHRAPEAIDAGKACICGRQAELAKFIMN